MNVKSAIQLLILLILVVFLFFFIKNTFFTTNQNIVNLDVEEESDIDKSDLNIFPWISSTFFEALYFKADMFVIEEDVFEKAFQQKLKDEIFYL